MLYSFALNVFILSQLFQATHLKAMNVRMCSLCGRLAMYCVVLKTPQTYRYVLEISYRKSLRMFAKFLLYKSVKQTLISKIQK